MLVLAMSLSSCCINKFKEINIKSASLETLSPVGLKGFDAVICLNIDNPAPSFSVKNMSVDILRGETVLFRAVSGNVAIDARSEKAYSIPVSGRLEPGTNLLSLARLLTNFHPGEYSIVLHAKASVMGFSKNLEYNLPLTQLLKTSAQ